MMTKMKELIEREDANFDPFRVRNSDKEFLPQIQLLCAETMIGQ